MCGTVTRNQSPARALEEACVPLPTHLKKSLDVGKGTVGWRGKLGESAHKITTALERKDGWAFPATVTLEFPLTAMCLTHLQVADLLYFATAHLAPSVFLQPFFQQAAATIITPSL